jgi:hypothetical protein
MFPLIETVSRSECNIETVILHFHQSCIKKRNMHEKDASGDKGQGLYHAKPRSTGGMHTTQGIRDKVGTKR